MVNRLQRDQIVIAALDAVDSPSLDVKERPGGTLTGTLGTGFLQRALDYFYKQFPVKGVLTSAAITLDSEYVNLPADYVQDFLNGIVLANDEGRLTRRSMSYLLSRPRNTEGKPVQYAVVDDTRIMLRNIPDKSYSATLYYYKLPAALGSTDIPPFPDDQVLVDFVEIRYKEWLQMIPKGSGMEYARQQVAALQKSGVGVEPEPDQIELDRQYYGDQGQGDLNDWMGKTSL
jgi:hypothetical protein